MSLAFFYLRIMDRRIIMRKVERVKAALASQPLDRPPVSSWMHYPSVDQDPLKLAQAHVNF